MHILFITHYFLPHVGGVEKQVSELSKRLLKQGHSVTILTEKYDDYLKTNEKFEKVNIIRIRHPKVKILGLIYIWLWILFHIRLITEADIVHAHGVLIWYWPFRLILPKKPIYTTFHGWEGIFPIPFKNKIVRKIDDFVAWKNITIHDYVEKYYGIKADKISYTAVDIPKDKKFRKDKDKIVYIGRLEENTGLPIILEALSYLKGVKIDFCGDGPLRKDCEKYGKVHGFTDPNPYLARSFICLSPGVTTILEAFTFKCLIITTYDNPLKKDYLLMTPFSKWIIVEKSPKKLAEKINYFRKHPDKAKNYIDSSYKWVKAQGWEKETNMYLDLWRV